ncbi:MAG: hemolysin III family protein [Myxococcota bacterium]
MRREVRATLRVKAVPEPAFTELEELWHALTHGAGAVLGLFALLALSLKAWDASPSAYWATITYASALVLVFASSTACHSLSRSKYALWFEMADHIAIFLMIAGTYTPVAVIVLPQPLGTQMLTAIWSSAAAGIAFKVVTYAMGWQERVRTLSVLVFLATGWVGLLAAAEIYEALSPEGWAWFCGGAALYTVGAGVYSLRTMPWSHLLWHFLILAAAACHFVAIYLYVI